LAALKNPSPLSNGMRSSSNYAASIKTSKRQASSSRVNRSSFSELRVVESGEPIAQLDVLSAPTAQRLWNLYQATPDPR
jgi:hypothetical protein